MKRIKMLDACLQLLIWIGVVVYVFIKIDFWFFGYLLVGVVQYVDMILHQSKRWFYYALRKDITILAHILVFGVLGFMGVGMIVPPFFYMIIFVLIGVLVLSFGMSLVYIGLSFYEATHIEKRPLELI